MPKNIDIEFNRWKIVIRECNLKKYYRLNIYSLQNIPLIILNI